MSAFLRPGDRVFHTYSCHERGIDLLNGTYNWLDLTALGRQEDWEQPAGRGDARGRAGCGATTSTSPPTSAARAARTSDAWPPGRQRRAVTAGRLTDGQGDVAAPAP